MLEIPCKVFGYSRLLGHLQKQNRGLCDLIVDYNQESDKHVIFWEHIGVNYYDLKNVVNSLNYRPKNTIFLVIDDTYEGLLTQENTQTIEEICSDFDLEYCIVSSNFNLKGKNVLHFNFNLVYKKFDGIDIQKDIAECNLFPRKKKFLCLNRQARFHRFETVDFFLKNQLDKDCYISLSDAELATAGNKRQDIDKKVINLYENNSVLDYNMISRCLDRESYLRLKQALPYDLDIDNWQKFSQDWKHLPNPERWYKQSYWSIITERDFYSCEYQGYTEKVLKAFFYRHPFIVIGLPYTIDILRNLGFVTFSSVINERYDLEEDHVKRKKLIYKEIKKLANLNYVEHFNLYHSIRDILDYNREHLIRLNANTIPSQLISRLQAWYAAL